jgi:hypothetical protein
MWQVKTSLERKKNPSVTRRCQRLLDENWAAASSAMLSARKLKFRLPASFEPTWCTSYSEFWNFEIPLKTQESKILKSVLKTFKKCYMAQNLVKDAFWKSLFWTFSDLENSEFSLIRKFWIFLEKRSKIGLRPSGYKLESLNFAWTCFARLSRKLHT